MSIFHGWYFINEDFFFFLHKCIIILLKNQRNSPFCAIKWRNINFSCRWYFLMHDSSPPMNMLLFCQKSAKFATSTNYRKHELSLWLMFLNAQFSFLFFLLKYAINFNENLQNSLFFATKYRNINFPCRWNFLNASKIYN